jgi:hypothetical protein
MGHHLDPLGVQYHFYKKKFKHFSKFIVLRMFMMPLHYSVAINRSMLIIASDNASPEFIRLNLLVRE